MKDHVYAIDDFSRDSLKEFYESRGNQDCTLWSPGEMEFLSQVSPLSALRVNRALGTDYPLEKSAFEVQARAKAANIISTSDNSILCGYSTRDVALVKLTDLTDIFEIEGIECPLKEELLNDDNALIMVAASKMLALKYLSDQKPSFSSYVLLEPNKENRNQAVSPQRNAVRGNAISFFKQVFGRNLDRIIEHETTTPRGNHTSHLFVLVKDIDMDSYLKMKYGRHQITRQRNISLTLMVTGLLGAYAASNYLSRMLYQTGTLIYGDAINMPELSNSQFVDLFLMRAGLDLCTLRGTLGSQRTQQNMKDNPVYTLKIFNYEKWIRAALLQKELGRQINVEDVKHYDSYSFNAVPRDPTVEQVREALYETNFRIKDRVHTYLSRAPKP